MNKVFIDFETYYDKQYSLSKMTTPEYIMDPRFKVLGCSIGINDEPVQWIEGDQLPQLDWENSEVIAHNCYFDGMILFLKYGVRAKRWCCTLSMARALTSFPKYSLQFLAHRLNLDAKLDGLTEGATQSDEKLIEYAIRDSEICRSIYNWLIPYLPEAEREVMHLCLRWGIEPSLCIDIPSMLKAADHEEAERARIIAESGVDEDILSSNAKFAKQISDMGLDPPTKISLTTGMVTIALGQNDSEYQEFISQHLAPDELKVWAGRKAAKSLINIQRPRKLAGIASIMPDDTIPMPIKYYGAHTGRMSGHDGFNVQNLPRSSMSRKAIIAPRNHVIVVADSSQIELRLNAWWSGEQWILNELVKPDGDVYKQTAAKQLNKPFDSITSDERQFAKAVVLGCGYGMGSEKFRKYCASGPMGMDPWFLSSEEADKTIKTYRRQNQKIVKSWEQHHEYLNFIMPRNRKPGKTLPDVTVGPIILGNSIVNLPNGMGLLYHNLEMTDEGCSFLYGGTRHYMYGAKLQQNIVQALARIVVMDQLLEIERQGIRTVSSTHDEVIAVAKESEAEQTYATMRQIMTTPPSWAPNLPLDCDGGFAENYIK